jgi:branched-subunit amino acid transport protein
MTPILWMTAALIGAATLIARLAPLLWRGRGREDAATPGWIGALGPCLLTAMGMAVLLPEALGAWETGRGAALLGGTGAAALAMMLRRDPGLAALAGVAGWWVAGAL